MVKFDGIKPTSGKLLALGSAIVFFIVGTSFVAGDAAVSLSKAIIMLTLGLILFIELGLKVFTPISDLRKLGPVQYITLSLAAVLFLGGLLAMPFVNVSQPAFLVTLTDFAIAAGSIWIVVEALTG